MKNLITPVFIMFWSHAALAQNISDCEGAIELCDDFYTEDQASLNTGNVYEFTGTCNANLEQSSVWYTFTVQNDGTLAFVLDPNNDNDDYDWGLFNITTGGCEGLGTTSPEVSCNSYGVFGANGPTGISTADGGTGNSNGPGNLNGPPYNADLNVTAGQTFALVIMNWTNSFDGYTIDFGGSTATLYDNVPPSPIEVEVDCANTSITLVFSEPILSSTVEGLDFNITGPGTINVTAAGPETMGATSDDHIVINFDQQELTVGTYTLTITDETGFVADACGNLGEGTITFELVNPLTFSVETTTACNGVNGSIALTTATGGVEPYVFSVNNIPQPDLVADLLLDGTYNVEIEDANGCVILQQIVVPDQLLSVSIPAQDTLSCLNPSFAIEGLAIAPQQPVSYVWTTTGSEAQLVNGNNSGAPVVAGPGIYTLTVTNTDNGCSVFESIEIAAGDVYGIDVSQLKIPNVFTPNADGFNDTWGPFLANDPTFEVIDIFQEYQLMVFNRWGTLVWENSSSEPRWRPADTVEGPYFFIFKYSTDCGVGASGTVEGVVQVLK